MIRERRGIVQSMVTAIATKPFLLLAGISGSGKTQMARRIAAGLAAGMLQDNRFLGIPFAGSNSASAYKSTLEANGVVPDIMGTRGDEYINIHNLEHLLDDGHYKSSGLEDVIKDRIAFLPVKPDWTDPQKIWGYYNPLTGLYYPTAATRVAMHAYLEFLAYGEAAPRHFIILDELNLARVEYYLADVLSLMEVPTTVDGQHVKLGELAPIHPFNRPLWTISAPQSELGQESSSHEQLYVGRMDRSWAVAYHYLSLGSAGMLLKRMPMNLSDVIHGADWHRVIPPQISFTPNLTIIGTVNVDETTHAFSPKVLDRAFVMEFNDMDYEAVCKQWTGYDGIHDSLELLHRILRPENLHFGYRTVREMLDYIEQAQGDWAVSGDFLMASKVLPKLRGGEDKLGSLLPPLLAYMITGSHDLSTLHQVATEIIQDIIEAKQMPQILERMQLSQPVYPISANKCFRMLRQLIETGLTGYF